MLSIISKNNIFIILYLCSFNIFLVADEYESVFTNVYEKGIWGCNSEGKGSSGGGSFPENCQQYIHYLQEFMSSRNIKSVVDAGCGDWGFSRYINWDGIEYVGYDVVKYIVELNQKRYSANKPNIIFVHGNFLTIDLPPADLLLCKHVLQHLPNQDILAFLPQLKKYKYILITNTINGATLSGNNEDTHIGGGHHLDFTKPPFNLRGTKVLAYRAGNFTDQVFLIDNTK